MRCACGAKDCEKNITFDARSKLMFVDDNEGKQISLYLDPNSIVYLIGELKDVLESIVSQSGSGPR